MMEENKGLDLSLGLPVGRSSSQSKDEKDDSVDSRAADGDRTSKLLNDFRNFLSGGNPQQEAAESSRIDYVKHQENYLSTISQAPVVGEKRKMPLEETNQEKKQESDRQSDVHDKAKSSRLSLTTDDGSMADNEDVAESEAEGSTSRMTSQHEDGSKLHIRSGSSSEVPKEVHGKLATGAASFSMQSMGTLSLPYAKDSSSMDLLGTPSYPLPSMMQALPSIRSSIQGLNGGNAPLMFGFSPLQHPSFDKGKAWIASQSFYPAHAARGLSPAGVLQGSPAIPDPSPLSQQASGEAKQTAEDGSSSHAEADTRSSNLQFRGKAAPEALATPNGFPSDYPAIRPGVSPDIKFGGSGSSPNLPWVSTTGPNGRIISGVTYKFNANQVRIVCACHGSHMSPEEFIQHAAEEPPAAGNGAGLVSPPSSNPATSARS